MPRRSLRPELNKIRGWVRQGRTDAWIAHQLEVTVQQIQAFKREQELEPSVAGDATAVSVVDYDDEIDLRAEDDALIAAELDAQAAEAAEAAAAAAAAAAKAAEAAEAAEAEESADGEKPKRRRSRRGGRSASSRTKRTPTGPLEATFDHGEEGYGLWLDPAVVDDPIYAEYWAGHRPVEVSIEEDQIIIRRAGTEESEDAEAEVEAE